MRVPAPNGGAAGWAIGKLRVICVVPNFLGQPCNNPRSSEMC
jgi:hypothetical protein